MCDPTHDWDQNGLGVTGKMQGGRYTEIMQRISEALGEAQRVLARYKPGEIQAEYKAGHDPVTEADHAVDAVLRKHLLRTGEGWLSEESADDRSRLEREHVWIVDPLDGTREFVEGIPEFCVSIAFVGCGRPVAGGICNPATKEVFLGCVDSGVTYNGSPAHVSERTSLQGALVLASRSESKRGEWREFQNAPFKVQPMGSVAYKLARVSAGLADATFTLTPKHEWDVAAGAALVLSGGGYVQPLLGSKLNCNQEHPLLPGLIACGARISGELLNLLSPKLQSAAEM
jgi:myo-inositol-1(or 4)-monophosphatase